LIKGPT
jgi:hypothetical protein